MTSIRWVILGYTFFSLCSSAYSKEVFGFQEKNIFNDKKIVLDYQPIKNNSLVYAACDFDTRRTNMSCVVVLEHFPTNKEVYKRVCVTDYQTNDTWKRIGYQFQLKLLYQDRVIFMWLEQPITKDLKVSSQTLIFRTIDMISCHGVETRITSEIVPFLYDDIDVFHVVPYANTFNFFFYNDSLCGDKMCGQTHDVDGNLINGPVASYLPAELFKYHVFVYPAKSRSPAMGHFLLSNKFYLVSSYYGKISELMDYPSGIDALAFSCDNGYLGFCWMSRYNERYVNCTQFNDKGDKTMSTTVELEYTPGIWMDMYNLADGGILVLTSECNDDTWCTVNVDSVAFYAIEVHKDNRVEQVHEIRGVDCNYVPHVKTDIVKKDNGDVCITFACHVGQDNSTESYVNLLSKCISDK